MYLFAPGKTHKTELSDIEHFHNQFHIQLINIHDLKHEIRNHLHEAEKYPDIGHRILHHYLKEKVHLQLDTLERLEQEFQHFIKS